MNTVSSSSDAYLYSDPEMLTTGWQDTSSGRRNQYKSSSSVYNNNSISSTSMGEQTSSVTVVSAPGTNIAANTTKSTSDVESHGDKKSIDGNNAVRYLTIRIPFTYYISVALLFIVF